MDIEAQELVFQFTSICKHQRCRTIRVMYSTRQGIGLSNVVRETIHPKGKGISVHASLSRGRVVYFEKSPNVYK